MATVLGTVGEFCWAEDPCWKPGQAIGLTVDVGPVGATQHYEFPPVGTADVLDNGPFDLLVSWGEPNCKRWTGTMTG